METGVRDGPHAGAGREEGGLRTDAGPNGHAHGPGTLHPSTPTPLRAVFAFTFLNSLGGGVVTTGFAFLAESAYGFKAADNYLLGLGQGVTYIIGALGVGPVLSLAMRRSPRVTARLVLAGLMAALAGLCLLPWIIQHQGKGSSWPFWVLVLGYSALTGVLWPIVESYMSGGRSGAELRAATGMFNVVWSSALVVAYLAMAPLLEGRPLEVVVGVGAVHLASAALLLAFASKPAAHIAEHHVAPPENYPRLLGVFRMQLPTSYLFYSALTPFLPVACRSLEVEQGWQTPLASVWLGSRVATFVVMQRWHGWHGRWTTAWAGALMLLAGFAGAVLTPRLGGLAGREIGIAALGVTLAVFGVGMGVVYCSALYYALSVGQAEVDAGGKHEALIGLGYLGGPACGLLAIGATQAGRGERIEALAGGRFEVVMMVLVAALASTIVVASLVRALGHAAADRNSRAGAG